MPSQKKPSPFVHVSSNDSGRAAATNIDGELILESNDEIKFIRVSYVNKPGFQNYLAA